MAEIKYMDLHHQRDHQDGDYSTYVNVRVDGLDREQAMELARRIETTTKHHVDKVRA
jgi:hypothetical protein